MRRRTNAQSQIARRISRKLVHIYVIIYIALLTLLLLLLTPQLYRNALNHEIQMNSVLTGEYEYFQQVLFESMNSLSDTFYNQLNAYEKQPTTELRAVIEQQLSLYAASFKNIVGLAVHTPSGDFISSFYYKNIDMEGLLTQNAHYQSLLDNHSKSYFSPVYKDSIVAAETETRLSIMDDLIYYSKNYNHGIYTYTLTAFYNCSNIIEKNNTLSSSAFDHYLILDKYGDLIYTNEDLFAISLMDHLQQNNTLTSTTGYFSFDQGLCFYKTNTTTGWIVISAISYLHMLRQLLIILGLVTALYLLSPLLYNHFLLPEIARQLAPLKFLSDTMTAFQAGEEIHSDIHTLDELETLSDNFNQMAVKINQQVSDIQQFAHANSVINYKLLATQIDPHFIYNTMNVINIMARQDNTAAIIEINTALIRILQERLNSKLSIYDTLRSEYETLIQYDLIMTYRHKHQIIIHYDIDERLMDTHIPKNILQPLVENSFYHGFGNTDQEICGNIVILIYEIDHELVIEVSDDGQGISEERLEQIMTQSYSIYADKKPHIGLNNIRQRLAYIYQDCATLEIHSTLGQGTTVIMTLPNELPDIFLENMIH